MDTNQLIEKLMSFGLTRQEATVYLALFETGTRTGYEVAKQTGISRSNAYNALAGLVDKGAAYAEEGTATRYTAVEVGEFCQNKISYLGRLKEELTLNMPKVREEVEGYLTITGDGHIADKVRNMLKEAKYRVYLEMEYEVLQKFLPQIEKMCAAKIKVVILSDKKDFKLSGAKVYETRAKA